MDVAKIKLSIAHILGTEEATLVAMEDKAVYVDGKPAADGSKYTAVTVVSAESGFERVTVKVEAKPDFSFINEDITNHNVAGDFIKVRFVGDVCKFWTDKAGKTQISARAQAVHLVVDDDETEINLS